MSQHEQEQQKYGFHVSDDGNFSPRPIVRSTAVSELPPGVYTLVYEEGTPMSGPKIYLRPESNFKAPTRLYGNIKTDVDRYLRSYELNDRNLGILLIGLRGSGKTLTLKSLAMKGIELGFITINVNKKIPGEILSWFLSTITQFTIVNFDEYEKMYNTEKEQKDILALLDGVDTGAKKIYCLTANEENGISRYLFDRPTRIRYIRRFTRLELATIVDYVQANLKNCTEEHLRAFIHMGLADAVRSNGMNFDSMAEYVREMNQFGGNLNDAMDLMAFQGRRSWTYFEITGFEDGQKKYRTRGGGDHPGAYMTDDFAITFSIQREELLPKEKPEDEDVYGTVPRTVKLTAEHFQHFGDAHDVLVFQKDGIEYHARYLNHAASTSLQEELEKEDNEKPGKSGTLPEMFMYQVASRAAKKREMMEQRGQSGASSTSGATLYSTPPLDTPKEPSPGEVEIKGVHLRQTGKHRHTPTEDNGREYSNDFTGNSPDTPSMNPRSISANVDFPNVGEDGLRIVQGKDDPGKPPYLVLQLPLNRNPSLNPDDDKKD